MLHRKYSGVSRPVTYVSHFLCNCQLFSLDQFNLKMSHAHKIRSYASSVVVHSPVWISADFMVKSLPSMCYNYGIWSSTWMPGIGAFPKPVLVFNSLFLWFSIAVILPSHLLVFSVIFHLSHPLCNFLHSLVTLSPRLNDSSRHFAVNTCCILASVADTFSHSYVSKCTAWWSNHWAQAT